MTSPTTANAGRHDQLFRAGWIVLIVGAALMTLNHVVLLFVLDSPLLFLGFALFTLYALVVAVIPLRRRERWAWYATWLLPMGMAAAAVIDVTNPNVAIFYIVAAAVGVAGMLLTARGVFVGQR